MREVLESRRIPAAKQAAQEVTLRHLFSRLKYIEELIRLQVQKLRALTQDDIDELRGLYITEEEIDALLGEERLSAALFRPPELRPRGLEEQGRAVWRPGKNVASRPRLEVLSEAFGLSPFEVEILLICLAPEIEIKYERLYAYLQNNVTRKRPTVDLVLKLLCRSFEEEIPARGFFMPPAPLLRHQLLRPYDDPQEKYPPLPARLLKCDERITDYLLGFDDLDTRIQRICALRPTHARLEDLILSADIKYRLISLLDRYLQGLLESSSGQPASGLIYFLQGRAGSGKKTTAEALCQHFDLPLLVVDLAALLENEQDCALTLRLLFREATLQDAALFLDHFDLLLGEKESAPLCRALLLDELRQRTGLTFIGSELYWEASGEFPQAPYITLEVDTLEQHNRVQLWERNIGQRSEDAPPLDLEAIADKFKFNGGQIKGVVSTARNRALWRSPQEALITMEDLNAACRTQANRTLGTLSVKINAVRTWSDLIMPTDQLIQLHDVCNMVKYRQKVYGTWGFSRKISSSKGMNVLFAGSSGTGKTMSAEIISGELGMDLYKIDLSSIVSKYIGETEKNLNKIFFEARESNVMLFFDEADALFGKRSEVRDSHDRYANIETSYLLQKMEEHDGIVIMATNLHTNMDDAFARRMHFTVQFVMPEEPERLRLWETIFPPEAPCGEDLDVAFMARQFKLSGGNIKNIILAAAFSAAASSGPIEMKHVIRATKREFQKMGKLCIASDFGRYFHLLKEEDI